MKILDDYLKRKGVNGFEDLTEEEQLTYSQWTEVLNKPDITVADIQKFMEAEKERCELLLDDYELSEKKRIFTQATSRLVRMLLAIITSPEKQKQQLQAQIQQLLTK